MKNAIKEFIANLSNPVQKGDSLQLLSYFEDLSGYDAYLDGDIIGFGTFTYQYGSGREGTAPVLSFSAKKKHIVIVITLGFSNAVDHLKLLGKHKVGKSCLYIGKLEDINIDVLGKIVKLSIEDMNKKYDCSNKNQG